MSTTPTPATFAAELPELTRADIARFVKEGRRRRAEETDKLFRSAGRGIVRLSRAVTQPLRLAWQRRRAYLKTRAELETYSARELAADLRLNPSDIPAIARGELLGTRGLSAAG